jgi:hypothetical protein
MAILRSSFVATCARQSGGAIRAIVRSSEFLDSCTTNCTAINSSGLAILSQTTASIARSSILDSLDLATFCVISVAAGVPTAQSLNATCNSVGRGPILLTAASAISFSTFRRNSADLTLSIDSNGRPSSVGTSNFLDNANHRGLIISATGNVTVVGCLFLGNGKAALDGAVVVLECVADAALSPAGVTVARGAATIAITDKLKGFCPGSGTLLLRSVPALPLIGPTFLGGTPLPTRTKVVLDRKGYFGYLIAADVGTFASIFVLACCLKRRPAGKRKLVPPDFILGDTIVEGIDNEPLDASA